MEPTAETGVFTLHMDNGLSVTGANGTTTFSALVLNANTYKTAAGDDFAVSTFKYYISNVKLAKADGSTYAVPDTYFLVDHATPATQALAMKGVPVGDYTGISFTVGVDSTRTKAVNFTGVLDANNGMYWDMNGPEFINLKLEGRSPQSPTTGLVFHIAGYKHATTNTIRTVTLPFPTAKLLVRTDHSPEIHMHVDLAKLFDGPNPVRFGTTYNVMGGLPAARIADNLAAGMFSVSHIHAN
ncbi:MbnP family protein [Hymenobacter humi]|uniref:MbnP family protein n=1 Tax=Hymenobacter humi TaxID=1411620 RepID=A0ABW2U3P6_9BACT